MASSTSKYSGGLGPDQSVGLARPAGNRMHPAPGSGHKAKRDGSHPRLRVASLNVGTLSDREGEVVETLTRRGIDLCCLQETRLTGGIEACLLYTSPSPRDS